MTSETDSRKRADAEAVAWKFKYEKAEQEKLYAQTHQKTVEVAVEKKVPYEKCEKCDRTAYRKAKEKCDSRKSQLEKKYKNMTIGYESILFLLAWYSITTTLFTAILSPVFLKKNEFDVERYMKRRPAVVKPEEPFEMYELEIEPDSDNEKN